MSLFASYMDKPLKLLPLNSAKLRRAEGQLYRELDALGLHRLRPELYWSTEWFSPDGSSAIAVPFYLESKGLCAFVRAQGACIEGDTPASFRRILLHEAGHCFEHAFGVRKLKTFIRLFGDWKSRTRPVVGQSDRGGYLSVVGPCYGSKHPLEDFAETFAYVALCRSKRIKERKLSSKQQEKFDFVAKQIKKQACKSRGLKQFFYFDGLYSRSRRSLRDVLRLM